MIAGERGIKKKASLTVTGSRRLQYTPEPETGSNHKKQKQHNQDRGNNIQESQGEKKHDTTISKNHKKKQAQPRHTQLTTNTTKTDATLTRSTCCWWLQVARCIVGALLFRDKKVAHVLQRHAFR
jgi:hypothetical protein